MNLFLSLLLAVTFTAAPDGMPKARQGTFALTNARIVTVSHGVIENGTLIIRGDQIVALGPNAAIPADAEVIDCAGLSIYPGMIDSGTRIGLAEVGSLAETRDFDEIGDLTPQVHALAAINPNSVLIPVTRVSGVTTALTAPSGSLLPGQAALVNLHGYTPDQMLVGDAEAVVMEFPRERRRTGDPTRDAEAEKATKEAFEQLNTTWDRAELYARIDSAYRANPEQDRRPEYVPAMEALVPVVRGEKPLLIDVDRAVDITKALEWVKERALTNVIFTGVSEGWRVADQIAAAGIPCVVGPVLSIPTRGSDRYDRAYANAGLLHQAGVQIAIRTGEAENVRNLPYHAGFAAAYGLGRDEALRAVTLGPAQIFGVADRIGSLDAGKQATLFVADGDPFETKTQVRHVFIDGWMIPMTSRQIRLYEEFLHRAPGLDENPATVTETN